MALSCGNWQRVRTSTHWSQRQQSPQTMLSHTHQRLLKQHQQQQLLVRKQHSFIETGCTAYGKPRAIRGHLQRGSSVDRSTGSVRQRLIAPTARQKSQTQLQLNKHVSIDADLHVRSDARDLSLRPLRTIDGLSGNRRSIVAWSSTSSLVKTLDKEARSVQGSSEVKRYSTNKALDLTKNTKNREQKSKPATTNALSIPKNAPTKAPSIEKSSENNKININIVLSQTIRATTEIDHLHSDIDSSLEGVETPPSTSSKPLELPIKPIVVSTQRSLAAGAPPCNLTTTAAQRRAQFQASRSVATLHPTPLPASAAVQVTATASLLPPAPCVVASAVNSTANTNLSPSPSLTIKRRPPLVRAMSAPVRTLDDNSKNVIAASKRKPRRRRLNTRNLSCDKSGIAEFGETGTDISSGKVNSNFDETNGKRILSRSKSTVGTDVITLVSLVSSEGSDSEKEDSSSGATTKSDNSPTRRAPSLRKTGKSVSFQESYPPNFQLATKEYSHMLRRGSIATFTARLRVQRPPTAPTLPFFDLDTNNFNKSNNQISATQENCMSAQARSSDDATKGEKDHPLISESATSVEYVYPDYVRSFKEQECWKLYQKMSNKGVSVAYETILRGMLTPTEFRQVQKQRELEEAKVRALAEKAAQPDVDTKPTTSAVERLSNALLKK